MGLFFRDDDHKIEGVRSVGFARYREVLEGSWKEFFLVGFISLILFIPFAGGMVWAVLSKSALIALLAGAAGGVFAGPGLGCLYDLILRRLRKDSSEWWICWKKAFRQNLAISVFTGIVQCVFMGLVIFSGALMLWGATKPSLGTIAILLVGSIFLSALLTVWWPQAVLFTQKPGIRLKNTLFFILFHPGRVFGGAVLQVVYWLILFLFLPWTAFVVPLLGDWYIIFLAVFFIYRPLNREFKVEEQIRAAFPDNLPEEEYIP